MADKVRIQDDLYLAINQEKLESLVIPDDKPVAGGFVELADEVEKTLMADFEQLAKSKDYPDANMEKAVKLYALAKDVKRRNRDGIKPILKHLHFIQETKDIHSFNRRLKNFVLNRYPLPFNMSVEVDMKDSNRHGLFFMGPQIILPDTTMYDPANPQKEMILNMWKGMVEQALAFTDLSEEERGQYIEDAIAFDAIIATLVKSREELSDYVKFYNLYRTGRVNGMMKPLNLKSLLKKLFGEVPEQVCVGDPRFLKGFKTLFNEENFSKYIHWSYIQFLLGNGEFLSEELRDVTGIYDRALMGIAKPTELKKFAYQLASSVLSEPVGYYYGLKYFGEEAKKDVVDMVKQIIEAYKERIASNDVLTESTKEKAILKLSVMKIKMGYPDKVDPLFDSFVVNTRDSLYKNILGIRQLRLLDEFSKLNKPVDKTKWLMPGHMVNACYDPQRNDITFPAAILQAPFYSLKQSRSENLGGIGAVIGHEISHAFDSNGAKLDENGNINNWWTKQDFKNFDKKVKAMIAQFEGIELPWGKVNSKLIVSENIADNGGVAVTLHIMKKMNDANYEEYFMNWARVWCLKATDQYRTLLLTMDVHGPSILRANMPPRNFEEWYQTFDVKKTDKMYIVPNKRVVIW